MQTYGETNAVCTDQSRTNDLNHGPVVFKKACFLGFSGSEETHCMGVYSGVYILFYFNSVSGSVRGVEALRGE